VLSDGLTSVEAACAEALAGGVHSADVVINILARHRDPGPVATILTSDALQLRHAPIADCARYGGVIHVQRWPITTFWSSQIRLRFFEVAF
jgi:hypothetical protein